ncbi:MAG: NUDIX domain-containing protein [Clostridia bacterium]|nr:NUDIX domain-containing protein [Clostridia bacterium]
MSARNSAKAIVIKDGKLLVNRCTSRFGEYYSLPGGGQRSGELLADTLRRELLEETGYTVSPLRLSGIYERISEGRDHKIYFIFLCKLENVPRRSPTEKDRFQLDAEWIDLSTASTRNLFPRAIRDNLGHMIRDGRTIFIGSEKRHAPTT